MYAELELTKDIENFIKNTETYNESFDEIKELLFTSKMKKNTYSITDILNITMQYQNIKRNTYYKVLHEEKLNFIEGMLIERLITKYNGLELVSVEKHLKMIEENCIIVPDKNKISKLFNFIFGLGTKS